MLTNIKKRVKKHINSLKARSRTKVFCIGRNKTGTTSLKNALNDFGYIIGNQREAERLIHAYAERDFDRIAQYCKRYQAFQDVPFSWPFTFIAMDQYFPDSKFVLTVRDSPEQWYQSVIRFNSKKFGDGDIPTSAQMREATYIYRGWIWDVNQLVYGAPEDDPYNKELFINSYVQHNEMVNEYFKHRQDDLLELNVAEEGAYHKLCEFLEEEPLYDEMPWENKTSDISST